MCAVPVVTSPHSILNGNVIFPPPCHLVWLQSTQFTLFSQLKLNNIGWAVMKCLVKVWKLKKLGKIFKQVTCWDCLILCKAYVTRQLNRYNNNNKKKKKPSRREGGFQGRLSTGQIAIILAGLATNSSTVAWAENLQTCFHPTFHLSAPFPKTHQSWKRARSQKDLLKMHAAKIWLKPLLTRHRVKDARPRRRVCWRTGRGGAGLGGLVGEGGRGGAESRINNIFYLMVWSVPVMRWE